MYRLLVVDDEFEARNAICSCFPWHEVGFEIAAQANNGKEALELIDQIEIDVILSDIRMPILNGIELAQSLYSRSKRPIIVFLSGYRDFEYAQKALAYGVRYYIVKPARFEELMDVFKELKRTLDIQVQLDEVITPPALGQNNVFTETSNIQDKLICTVKKYIESEYQTATLEDAARLIHMNTSYLSQLFKQRSGANFSDYLIETKMKVAKQQLNNVDLHIYEISEMVGYTNPKNFSRTFKYHFGLSPKEYRMHKFGISDHIE